MTKRVCQNGCGKWAQGGATWPYCYRCARKLRHYDDKPIVRKNGDISEEEIERRFQAAKARIRAGL